MSKPAITEQMNKKILILDGRYGHHAAKCRADSGQISAAKNTKAAMNT